MPLPRLLHGTRALVATCCATALLGACSILPKNEPVQTWQPPAGTTTPATVHADFSLRVDTPNTTGMLSGNSIVVMPAPGEVSTYKGARWSEAPALLVRHRLVDAFMAAGSPAVTTDDDRFSADYTLDGDLRAFQSEYRSGQPVVVVRYDAQLRSGFSRTPLATHSFVVTENPSGVEVPQIVAAFGTADDKLAQQVVAWTVEAASRDQQAQPNPPERPSPRRR
ncbi:MAG: ABC-type transport auxiliary lipoprotein family protein [Rhodanobacteraceae bacterium]